GNRTPPVPGRRMTAPQTLAALAVALAVLSWLVPAPLARLLLRLVYRFRVYGAERIPATGPALVVCNHVSGIDRLVLRAACPRRVRFVPWAAVGAALDRGEVVA